MFQREQRGDYVLDRWRAFPRIVNESALRREEKPRIRSAIARELRPLLDDRAHYLLASSLARDPRATRLSKLLTWARQYPPLWHSRFFWGAMRRTLLR
jgi:hypothetical protein